jgi:hypothetical protein
LKTSTPSRHEGRWLRRRRLILLGGIGAVVALAIAVPVAWATFGDVPPSNPFYADINAIQGAGITAGCGGGNFCPTDPITRQAEAAFVHRGLPRVGLDLESQGEPVLGGTPTDLSVLTVNVGGVAGQTQFVKLDAAVSTYISSTTGCPCVTQYYITQDGVGRVSLFHYSTNDSVNGGFGFGIETGAATAVATVPTGTTQTFRVKAVRGGSGGSVQGYSSLSAISGAFGSTGANTLQVSSTSGTLGKGK